jgi:hypothetical protein
MGYCATTILVWGVRLSSDQAQKVYNYLQETDELFQSDGEISIDVDDILKESPVGRRFGRRIQICTQKELILEYITILMKKDIIMFLGCM